MFPFSRLRAWRACHELAIAVYQVTRRFPADERYGLTSQLRRAAVSSAANLAEGSARHGKKEFRRFTQIAFGSLVEVAYLIELAKNLGHIPAENAAALHQTREQAARQTWRLCQSLAPTTERQ